MKPRLLVLLTALAMVAALAIAGCGGGGSSGSGSDPAGVAPPKTPFYIEASVRPEGEQKENVESVFEKVSGVDTDLGELIVTELEKSAKASGESFDYEKEVEPWLGEKAGLFFERYDGENFTNFGLAVQTTDTGASEEFIEDQAKSGAGAVKEGSFEGVDFTVEPGNGLTIGVVEGLLVLAENEATFKTTVEASKGESLSEKESFTTAIQGDANDSDSIATVFVDIGGLIEQTGAGIDPETEVFLESSGLEPKEATAVASIVPDSDQVEIDFSSNVTGKKPESSGDVSKLLGSLPGSSFAAFASADFGTRFGEAIDRIDANGIPGQIEPNELKGALSAVGIDLDKISASIGDLGVFAQGNTEKNLTGAVVLTTKDSQEAAGTVSSVGLLLRAAGTPGVTAISGKASGFSVRDPELGRQPLVVAAEGDRIAISYGLAASAQALTASSGATLASNPAYKEAVASLGDTPISGYVAGPAALQLASAMVSPEKRARFETAKPYLSNISYVAIGAGSSDELTTAKVIVGLTK